MPNKLDINSKLPLEAFFSRKKEATVTCFRLYLWHLFLFLCDEQGGITPGLSNC